MEEKIFNIECYKTIIDIYCLIQEDEFAYESGNPLFEDIINDMGIIGFLDDCKKYEKDIERQILNKFKTEEDAKNYSVRNHTKLNLKEVIRVNKENLMYLPRTNYQNKIFADTKRRLQIIFIEFPNIIEDLKTNGLRKTINVLSEHYNFNTNTVNDEVNN